MTLFAEDIAKNGINFKLSNKIETLKSKYDDGFRDYIEIEDVKEFIYLLKEYCFAYDKNVYEGADANKAIDDILQEINKLAGDLK